MIRLVSILRIIVYALSLVGFIYVADTNPKKNLPNRDNMLRAYDKKMGELLWETTLPGRGRATAVT